MNNPNDFKFTPTAGHTALVNVPFFEEARADFAPHYGNYFAGKKAKTVSYAQNAVLQELAKLGAGSILFEDGYFGENPKRYGYRLRFMYGGVHGLIRVAGLPIKDEETDKKLNGVKYQALMNVRDWLKATVTSMVFAPSSDILIPHLLVSPDSDMTIADHIRTQGNIPQLTSGA
jgi:hypothetical protein